MIVVPANPNHVQVGMVRTGCFKTQFNSAYPARLNGIISQHEFRESINNINSKIGSNNLLMYCFVFFILCTVAGLGLTIAGAIVASSIRLSSNLFLILLIIGGVLIVFGPVVYAIGTCIIRIRRTTKMRQAIAEESKKYSITSPGACTWRLNVNRIWTGYGRYNRIIYVYHIIIDIHRSGAPSGSANLYPNQFASRPTSTVRPQDNIFPTPYPGSSAAFCSQCGAPKSESTAKFCSVCGHRFDSY